MEQFLAENWQELLGIEGVGINDNFFELGGNSLPATQLISRVRDTFQIKLPLESIFEFPTIAGMAVCMETIRWVTQDSPVSSEGETLDRDEGEL